MAKNIDQSQLQTAIGQFLAADASLSALLGDASGRIQGHPNSDIPLPYISIGDDWSRDASVQGLSARKVRVSVHAWTKEKGFALNKEIESHVVGLLDEADIAVPGHRVVSCFHFRTRFIRGKDIDVKHGNIEFEVDLE